MIYREFSRKKNTRDQINVLWVGKTWRGKMPTLVPACVRAPYLYSFARQLPLLELSD